MQASDPHGEAERTSRRRESGFQPRTWGTSLGALRPVQPIAVGRHPTFVARAGGDLVIVERIETRDGAQAERVARIVRRLVTLRDPNVGPVTGLEAGVRETLVVSPLLDAERYDAVVDLASEARSAMPLEMHLRVILDVLSGLHTLHTLRDAAGPMDIVHGDVRPAQVMLGTDGNAKLVQVAHARGARAHTTPYQAQEAHRVSASCRADVYSCGVMLWDALAGKRPPEAPRVGAPKRVTLPLLEPWAAPLAQVALRATATYPMTRHASAKELARDLRRVAGTHVATKAALAAFVKERCAERLAARRRERMGDAAAGELEAEDLRDLGEADEETKRDLRAVLAAALARASAAADAEEDEPTRLRPRACTLVPPAHALPAPAPPAPPPAFAPLAVAPPAPAPRAPAFAPLAVAPPAPASRAPAMPLWVALVLVLVGALMGAAVTTAFIAAMQRS